MDSVFSTKNKCCGCTACYNICPKNAITLKSDDLGFIYPEINQAVCINCGRCVGVCAFQNGYSPDNHFDSPLSYAAVNKADSVVSHSSSGGSFNAIAQYIIKQGGIVYGASFDDKLLVSHIAVTKIEDLPRIQSSKYVQSNLGSTYKDIRQLLENGKLVLFSGTGCQVQGLLSFLGKKQYDNLFLCDIVCHGVPSTKYYNDYLEYMSQKYNSTIKSINFRAKEIPGQIQDVKITFNNGKTYNEYPDVDPFRALFSNGYIMRQSCFECRYSNTVRTGDVTLGDFWGLQKSDVNFNTSSGVSLVLINSPKGRLLFDNVCESLHFKPTKLENSLQFNLKQPTPKPNDYDEFLSYYDNHNIGLAAKKFSRISFKTKLVRKLKIKNSK